jgi:hypothetical protein
MVSLVTATFPLLAGSHSIIVINGVVCAINISRYTSISSKITLDMGKMTPLGEKLLSAKI